MGWDIVYIQAVYLFKISIHPPRVGWDFHNVNKVTHNRNFNPPTPCGVGLRLEGHIGEAEQFQSTHPVWGGTGLPGSHECAGGISIHPPRVGWDPCDQYGQPSGQIISIHPPRVGWDPISERFTVSELVISIHPPRVGWDPLAPDLGTQEQNFNPPTRCGVGPATRI